MEAKPVKVEHAYDGAIVSEIDVVILFGSCFSGVTSFAPHGPSPGGKDVRSGHIYVLRDLSKESRDLSDWEDGKCWEHIGEDDDGFQHFKNSTGETLRKKTWTEDYRQQRFGLVVYYSEGEAVKQRPSEDLDLLTSVYEVNKPSHISDLTRLIDFIAAILLVQRLQDEASNQPTP